MGTSSIIQKISVIGNNRVGESMKILFKWLTGYIELFFKDFKQVK